MILVKKLLLALVVFVTLPAAAQKAAHVPEKFTISEQELAALLSATTEKPLSMPANPYLNKAVAVKNVHTGDMQFVRLKLAYFKDAYLNVQVNGIYTTQVFLLSEQGSTFYKGATSDGVVVMEKCTKEDIVVE